MGGDEGWGVASTRGVGYGGRREKSGCGVPGDAPSLSSCASASVRRTSLISRSPRIIFDESKWTEPYVGMSRRAAASGGPARERAAAAVWRTTLLSFVTPIFTHHSSPRAPFASARFADRPARAMTATTSASAAGDVPVKDMLPLGLKPQKICDMVRAVHPARPSASKLRIRPLLDPPSLP